VVIQAKKAAPVSVLRARWIKRLCHAKVSHGSGANRVVSCSLTFPAIRLGSCRLLMWLFLLVDVLYATHIVQNSLMMSKTSEDPTFRPLARLRLMHMGYSPLWRCTARSAVD